MDILVIADDFTGANDTGVQFYKKGMIVDVILSPKCNINTVADVLVINTNSRAMSPEDAKNIVSSSVEKFTDVKWIYKKIDSTLRGNIGSEIEACLNHERRVAFVCSAYPLAGRVINNGICYVNGQPLLETEFSTDPKTPVFSSNVDEIISSQTKIPIIHININNLRGNKVIHIVRDILDNNEKCIISFDAINDDDLIKISEFFESFNEPSLIVGSSGLAQYIRVNKIIKPFVFVVASMSEKTKCQLDYIKDRSDIKFIDLSVEEILMSRGCYIESIIEKSKSILNSGFHLVLKVENDKRSRDRIDGVCEKLGVSRVELGENICKKLSLITKVLINKYYGVISGIFLTGGDTAIAVSESLSLSSYHIKGEIEPGVPYGYFTDSFVKNIPIITKAGGLGSIQALKKVIDFIYN